jgi:hypothetical protein
LDKSDVCDLPGVIHGFDDPARIDFVNNVSVYRAPIVWENHSDEDDDYTLNQHSPGGELYDKQTSDARVHVEFDSEETIDQFTEKDTAVGSFGAANQWWTQLRDTVDNSPGSDDQKDINVRCFMQKFVNPSLTTQICDQLPLSSPGIEPTCPDRPDGKCKDPMAVVVGVPSMDCGDHPKENTAEIHPAYAVAIRIQESTQDHPQPEQWAFFYRESGDNGACGSSVYRRCGTTFQLPLSLPFVPARQVLKSADVHVDFHSWAVDGSFPSDVTVEPQFDLANGTVLTITLPGKTDIIDLFGHPVVVPIGEGVVGLVTITPVLDTTPPTITCPGNITMPPDLGKCTAVAAFTPTISDDCSVSAVCSPPSGTAFPLGMTTDTCTATDQAGLSASCSFTVTVTPGNKCPLGEGYWKNHTNLWAVNSLTLGSVTYTKVQLISILNSPTKGDASVILAKQLIAALLNLANGSNPVAVCNTIADANSALDGCTVPCGISPNSSKGQAMISDANSLEMYNSGKLTAGCAP